VKFRSRRAEVYKGCWLIEQKLDQKIAIQFWLSTCILHCSQSVSREYILGMANLHMHKIIIFFYVRSLNYSKINLIVSASVGRSTFDDRTKRQQGLVVLVTFTCFVSFENWNLQQRRLVSTDTAVRSACASYLCKRFQTEENALYGLRPCIREHERVQWRINLEWELVAFYILTGSARPKL